MCKTSKAIRILLTALGGSVGGVCVFLYHHRADIVIQLPIQRILAASGSSARDDRVGVHRSVSLNAYVDFETESEGELGRTTWGVRVYPDTPHELGYSVEGVSSEAIDEGTIVIGSKQSRRRLLLIWDRISGDYPLHVRLLVYTGSEDLMSYWDINGDGQWDLEEDWRVNNGAKRLRGRFLLVDGEYFHVSRMSDRFAGACTILERDKTESPVFFVDGKWRRTDDHNSVGLK